MNTKTASETVDLKAKVFMASTASRPGISYSEAVSYVLTNDPELKHAYTGVEAPVVIFKAQVSGTAAKAAGKKLAARADYYLKIHNSSTYSEAFAEVCAQHPDWKALYTGFQS